MLLYNFTSIEEEKEFLKFMSKYVDEDILYAMREVLGDKMYFALYLLSGKIIEFPDKTKMVRKIKSIRSRMYGRVKRGKREPASL